VSVSAEEEREGTHESLRKSQAALATSCAKLPSFSFPFQIFSAASIATHCGILTVKSKLNELNIASSTIVIFRRKSRKSLLPISGGRDWTSSRLYRPREMSRMIWVILRTDLGSSSDLQARKTAAPAAAWRGRRGSSAFRLETS
jgi:hypothetical protein